MSTAKFETALDEQRKMVKKIVKQRTKLPKKMGELSERLEAMREKDLNDVEQLVLAGEAYEEFTRENLRKAAKYFRSYHRNLEKITDPDLRRKFEKGHEEAIKTFSEVIEKCRALENKLATIINDEDMEIIRYWRLIAQPVECDDEEEKQMPDRINLLAHLTAQNNTEESLTTQESDAKKKSVHFPEDAELREERVMKTQYLKTAAKEEQSTAEATKKRRIPKIESKFRDPFVKERAKDTLAMPADGPVRKPALKQVLVEEINKMRDAASQREQRRKECLEIFGQIKDETYRQAAINKVNSLPDGIAFPDKSFIQGFVDELNGYKEIARKRHGQMIDKHCIDFLGVMEEAFPKKERIAPPVANTGPKTSAAPESSSRSDVIARDKPPMLIPSMHRRPRT